MAAQSVDGLVTDMQTGAPLPAAMVVLLDTAGNEFMRTESGDDGTFIFRIPSPGRYRLWADRLGYDQLLGRLLEVDAAPVYVELQMPALPIALDEVRVTAEARRLALDQTGYYQRRDLGIGQFVDLEQIEARSPLETTDILRTQPMVRLLPDAGSEGGVGTAMVFRGAVRGLQQGGGRPCLPTLVVDGRKVRDSGPLADNSQNGKRPIRLNELIHPTEILAMELYPNGAGAPPQWSGMDAYCGVVVIWTKKRRP